MKLPSLKLAALAIAGLAVFSPSAKAATVTTSVGDLILGVYQTNGVPADGAGKSYEVDLGSFTSFPSTASNVNLSSLVSITDLDAIFGGSAGLATTDWFVVGTQGTGTLSYPGGATPAQNTVFITDSASSAPVGADASGGALGAGPASQIGGLQANLDVTPFSSNSPAAAEFSVAVPANGPQFGLNADIITQTAFAGSDSFYELSPNGHSSTGIVTPLGSFDFVGGTTFTFNPVAAPEPSTYALMGLGALLLVITARRRMASNS
jgi:hypothetical protein